jgi:hypothetical protein
MGIDTNAETLGTDLRGFCAVSICSPLRGKGAGGIGSWTFVLSVLSESGKLNTAQQKENNA